jgi:exopolysaccharide production protein ExoY
MSAINVRPTTSRSSESSRRPNAAAASHPGRSAVSQPRQTQTLYARFGKRAFDVVLALMMLPTIILVLLVVLPFVVSDRGAFFYSHPRVGRGGKLFGCIKIRTMRTDSAQQLANLLATDPEAAREWAANQKLQRDPRITRIGRILRKTSLDELPQLWNVIRGDMSLVGPRPVTSEELDRYGGARDLYLAVNPGITGLWQIAPMRYDMSYAERVEVDAAYAQSVSFMGDMRILYGTLLWALRPNGV